MQCSLYIHIPFCKSKCRYCDFISFTRKEDQIDAYLDALAAEYKLYEDSGSYEFKTVYIGGGTPSLLSLNQWERLWKILVSWLPLLPQAEFTVEINPGSWSADKASLLASMGVNRLVIGIQSLDQRVLEAANRPYSSCQAEAVLEDPSLHCFHSIGVDLMYGMPGQTTASFEKTLLTVLGKTVVKHLSVYELTLAEHTPWGRHRTILPLPDEQTVSAMTELLLSATENAGFIRYEISNFSREGFRCAHNCAYWSHDPYIGLGCASHSYIHPRRFWNFGSIEKYLSKVDNKQFPIEQEEIINPSTLAREMIFLGLRRIEGINEVLFREKTGMDFRTWAGEERLSKFIDEKFIEYHPPWWKPTRRGMLFADHIASELF